MLCLGGEFIELYGNLNFPFLNVPLIAPFWGDIDTENTGEVLYRFTANQTLISVVNSYINNAFDIETSMEILFIATWSRVIQYNTDSSQVTINNYYTKSINNYYYCYFTLVQHFPTCLSN